MALPSISPGWDSCDPSSTAPVMYITLVCMWGCVHACMSVACVYLCMCVPVHVCVYVCMCVVFELTEL